PTWGFCDYPLVDDDRLICTPGGPETSLVALNKRTGKEIWRSAVPNAGLAAYAALMVTEVGGVRHYVAFLGNALVGVRASDGRPLWRYEKLSNGTANSHTPIVRGDQIVTSNGYGTGLALLKLVAKGEEFEVHEQYINRLSPDAFQDNGVIVGDQLFTGGAGASLMCVDWKSGERVWSARAGSGRLAITFADDRLYVRTSDGLVILADASRNAYGERGRFAIPDAVKGMGATYPVIAGGRLYLRDDNKLLCYDIREDAFAQPPAKPQSVVLPAPAAAPVNEPRERTLRSVFVPTPQDVVEKMLEMAGTKQTDVVYDLGSGDGRIVITAAKKYGCKSVGYELDKDLVEQSNTKADAAGVKSLVTFEHKDLFTADLRDADVVAVFLLPQQLKKLLPQWEKLKPGARIVSHQFEIPGVKPDQTLTVNSLDDGARHSIHLWTTPFKNSPPAVLKED
ncbi:MAG: PQQ-binding-like beta-propeller repeat protein, partial [Planctomycetota bacterium]